MQRKQNDPRAPRRSPARATRQPLVLRAKRPDSSRWPGGVRGAGTVRPSSGWARSWTPPAAGIRGGSAGLARAWEALLCPSFFPQIQPRWTGHTTTPGGPSRGCQQAPGQTRGPCLVGHGPGSLANRTPWLQGALPWPARPLKLCARRLPGPESPAPHRCGTPAGGRVPWSNQIASRRPAAGNDASSSAGQSRGSQYRAAWPEDRAAGEVGRGSGSSRRRTR